MSAWLIDTLLYTGTLIALVLVLRRPVGRFFGPQIAYALWALPFLRLLLPPIELPAWLAPARPEPEAIAPANDLLFVCLCQPLQGEFPNQLQHPKARLFAVIRLRIQIRAPFKERKKLMNAPPPAQTGRRTQRAARRVI